MSYNRNLSIHVLKLWEKIENIGLYWIKTSFLMGSLNTNQQVIMNFDLKFYLMVIVFINKRLLSNDEESRLCDHTDIVTSLKKYLPIAERYWTELFYRGECEEYYLIQSCHFIANIEVSGRDLK